VAIGPDGCNTSYRLTFNCNKYSVSSDPLPHLVCRLVAEPHRQSSRVAVVVELAQFAYRPPYDTDCAVSIGNLSCSDLHVKPPGLWVHGLEDAPALV
jgi:hypothetical protein